jgi:putative nucleotidyltransferase with HDIG domain
VDTLTSAMRRESKLFLPLVPLKQTDQYTTVHSMNTSVLAIALGEFMHLSGPEVRVVGEAALLHDVGKVVVPPDILNKPGKLDDREWQEIVRHPVEGARILLNSGQGLEVAAVAAYEHHLRWDGGGYPDLKFKRPPHRVSQLVHLCDAYDAMRTKRPFQDPLPPDVIIDILLKGKGSNFDPDLVDLFVSMIRRWEERARGGTTARS